jgi:hypothetical protein
VPQVARIDDSIIAATSSSNGGIYLLMMQLPPIPGAASADLQVRPPDEPFFILLYDMKHSSGSAWPVC